MQKVKKICADFNESFFFFLPSSFSSSFFQQLSIDLDREKRSNNRVVTVKDTVFETSNHSLISPEFGSNLDACPTEYRTASHLLNIPIAHRPCIRLRVINDDGSSPTFRRATFEFLRKSSPRRLRYIAGRDRKRETVSNRPRLPIGTVGKVEKAASSFVSARTASRARYDNTYRRLIKRIT